MPLGRPRRRYGAFELQDDRCATFEDLQELLSGKPKRSRREAAQKALKARFEADDMKEPQAND